MATKTTGGGAVNGGASSITRHDSVTFASQGHLPRLPIPKLEDTLSKFQETLKALQTEEERKETSTIVQEFLKSGDGPKLQALLEAYEHEGRSGRLGSYVEEFWNDSYLAPDDSVVLNLNPFFVLEEGPDPKTAKDPILRAASLTFASIKLASLLKHEKLTPDSFKGRPLCMDQFKALFGSCRVPKSGPGVADAVAVYPESTHVAVLCRNEFYYFEALWKETGVVAVDEADIVHILTAIQRDANKDPGQATEALGVLTSLPRNQWAKIRQDITSLREENANSFHIIDSALFVLVLDDGYYPNDIHEAAANMLHGTYKMDDEQHQLGTCCNRWYDKLQIIVCGNGTAGFNFEHSAIDGHTALRFVSDIFAETVVTFAQSITKLVHGAGRIPSVIDAKVKRASACPLDHLDVSPKRLSMELLPSTRKQIYFAETALGDQIVASDTVVLEFKRFGKRLIVSNRQSPDSFVQMSMLLAYYKLYGKVVCMYESVMTKHFYHGRTEAMRTVTPAALELCEAWTDDEVPNDIKLEKLRAATKEHSRLVKEAAAGKGVDRHLFALKCIAQRTEDCDVPAFFSSKPWQTLNHTILSTSNCGNPSLRLFGFGPVVQDGFGIGYIIKDHGLQYSISSKHRQTHRFTKMLENTLIEMEKLLTPLNNVRVGSYHGPSRSISASDSSSDAPSSQPCNSEDVDTPFPASRRLREILPVFSGGSARDEAEGPSSKAVARPKRKSFSQFLGNVIRHESRHFVIGRTGSDVEDVVTEGESKREYFDSL